MTHETLGWVQKKILKYSSKVINFLKKDERTRQQSIEYYMQRNETDGEEKRTTKEGCEEDHLVHATKRKGVKRTTWFMQLMVSWLSFENWKLRPKPNATLAEIQGNCEWCQTLSTWNVRGVVHSLTVSASSKLNSGDVTKEGIKYELSTLRKNPPSFLLNFF